MMNSVGSILGPLIVSFLLGYTHMALFVVSGVALSILACWTLYRIRFHDVAREHYEPFVSMRSTTQEVVEMGLESEESEEPSDMKVQTKIQTSRSISHDGGGHLHVSM